jgi:hypothetical protein
MRPGGPGARRVSHGRVRAAAALAPHRRKGLRGARASARGRAGSPLSWPALAPSPLSALPPGRSTRCLAAGPAAWSRGEALDLTTKMAVWMVSCMTVTRTWFHMPIHGIQLLMGLLLLDKTGLIYLCDCFSICVLNLAS